MNFKDLTISWRRVEAKATRERKSRRTKDDEVSSRFVRQTVRSVRVELRAIAARTIRHYLAREKENRRIVTPYVTLRCGKALRAINWHDSCHVTATLNPDANKIHAVISVTLMMPTSFTSDRYGGRSRKISHGSLVANRVHAARVYDPIRSDPSLSQGDVLLAIFSPETTITRRISPLP